MSSKVNHRVKKRTLRERRRLHFESLDERLPFDVDDSISEGLLLGTASTTPIVRSDSISPDTDVDMWRISVAAGQTVDFDIDTPTNGPGSLGSFLRIFNSSGTELAFNNDARAPGEAGVGFDAYIRYTFPTSGNYFVSVSNNTNTLFNPLTGTGDVAGGANSTGTYTLTATGLPIDTDDTLTEATNFSSITTVPDVASNQAINPDIDVDMYRFTVSAGQSVDFDIDSTINGPGGLDSFLRIFNSTGTELAFNDDAPGVGENVVGWDAYLRYTFATSGTYYVGVSNWTNTLYNASTGDGDVAGGNDPVGTYTLTVQTTATVNDTDDQISEATNLGTITGAVTTSPAGSAITPDVDVDMYRFTATAGQIIDFDIDTTLNGTGGLGSYLRLFNSSGTQLAFNNDAAAPGEATVGFDSYLRHTFATSGNYYIAVSNNNNITYNPTTGTGDTANNLNATGNYTLNIQGVVVDTDDQISEATPLGSITTAADTVTDSIAQDTDVDMYQFTVAAGQVVDFDIDTPQNGPGGVDAFIRVFNSSGQELGFNNNAAGQGENVVVFDSYLRFTFATAGTYYVGVSNGSNTLYNATTGNGDTAGGANSTGAYTLIVQTAPAVPVDGDDSLSEAPNLGSITTTPISTSNTQISPDVDVDMYRFAATAGQIIDIDIDTTLNGPGGLGSFIRLFNSTGTEIAFNNDAAAPGETLGFDAYLRFTVQATGTYYVGVSNATNTLYNATTGDGDVAGGANSTGTYVLTLAAVAVDTDDQMSEATPIGGVSTSPYTKNDNISPDIDVDLYSFTVAANSTVDFDIDTTLNGAGGLGSYLRLFNSSGTQIAFNNDASAPGETTLGFDAYLRHFFSTGGTYYVGVSNNNNAIYNVSTGTGDTSGGANSTGAYSLRVQLISTSSADPDDTIAEATALAAPSTTPQIISASIAPDTDVSMYRFTVTANQSVDFDIDTGANGVGGLGSYLRIFDSTGLQLAANNDAAAPGETVVGFDAYLRYTFATAGTYYVGVSNATNITYNPTSGSNDVSGGANATGGYQLIVTSQPLATLTLTAVANSISELGGSTVATITRTNANITAALTINLSSNDITEATVPLTVTIPANQASATFTITGVDDPIVDGTQTVIITAAGTGFANATYSLQVTDSDTAGAALALSSVAGSISESNGTTVGTVSRTNANLTQPLVVNLSSSDTTEATVPTTVTIPANQASVTFTITAVNDVIIDGTQNVTITATATGLTNATLPIQVIDNDGTAALALSATVVTFSELSGTSVGTVTRSNTAITQPLVVNLVSSDTTEATVPATVTIPANQTSITFNITAVDDAIVDGTQNVTITATATGLTNATLPLQVTDNEAGGTLALSSVSGTISEFNGTTVGTVTRTSGNITQPLVVNLASSDTTEANAPLTVTIPANQTSVTFTITGVDDAIVDGTQSVTITATATGLTSATLPVQVTDNDLAPALTLSSSASSISELNGTTVGTVTRTNANLTQPLVVSLASSDTSEATVPATVTIPANQTSITFTITGIDDLIVDGTQSVSITATATGLTSANLPLQVTDNDSAASLTLSAVAMVISEGNGSTTGTVSRNTANIAQALVVNLTSSDTSEATVPLTVTIPANAVSAQFTITAVDDLVIDGSQGVTITAAATGLSNATLAIQVTDNDSLWQNPDNPLDVNDDGEITAFDVIPLINYLNTIGAGPVPGGSPPPYLDVNSDNAITALDVLPVINYLNNNPVPPSSPEATGSGGEAIAAGSSSRNVEVQAVDGQVQAADAYFAQLGAQKDRERRMLQQQH